ncbi:MAG: DUF3750 domain-containing protein [Rhizobiaceae bacterium]|nr:DUF3750 domain-containing protein [Rhizobiaceae bacterium]
MKLIKRILLFVILVFIVPALASLAVWEADASKPRQWHQANWSSAGILPKAEQVSDAAIYLMAARTGRWKGAFSLHSWIVIKRAGAVSYDRYEVVGWGTPLRKNAYPADARWYSNEPEILHVIEGDAAEQFIPLFERAISEYPKSKRGDYTVWPGPNSNSFIAYLLNEVSELQLALPSNAIGRDWPQEGEWIRFDDDYRNVQASLGGLIGFSLGSRHGFELNFLGLVAGIDFNEPGIKLPGFGNLPIY